MRSRSVLITTCLSTGTKRASKIAKEVVSFASFAASMERRQLETRVFPLESQLLLERQAKAKVASMSEQTADTVNTADTVDTMKTYNACLLWWIAQSVYECKMELATTDTNANKQKLKSYTDFCIRNKKKVEAGMKHFKHAPSASASPAAGSPWRQ